MRAVVVAVLALCACKRAAPARHIALGPGPAAVLDPSPSPTLPVNAPVVDAREEGGFAPATLWQVRVWDDGTIAFAGVRCHGTHRATLPASRVKELVDALAQLDFEHPAPVPKDDFCNDGYQTVVVASNRRIDRTNCTKTTDPTLDNALDLIRTAVGAVPCDQNVLKF